MNKRNNLFPTFVIFFILAVLLFWLSHFAFFKPVRSFLEVVTISIQKSGSIITHAFFGSFENKEIKKLQEENRSLAKKFIDQTTLQRENNALKDQFQTTVVAPLSLLPAHVLGTSQFIPALSSLETLILDKGEKNGVKVGMGVIVKDNVVGKIKKVSPHLCEVLLVSNKDITLPAKTLHTQALGIIRGKGNGEMVFENVLLSERLESSDFVVTFLSSDSQGGLSSNLIVGKIIASQKKPSDLFQKAQVKSLLDFSKLTTVFIITGNKK